MTTALVRGIAGLDRLAEELAAACPPRLGIADSPAELLAAHRLARAAFDARSLQICAWDGDTLVGTLRLALPMPGKRLPVEEEFDLTVAGARLLAVYRDLLGDAAAPAGEAAA